MGFVAKPPYTARVSHQQLHFRITSILGGVLIVLNGGKAQPFLQRPDVVGQTGRHRGGPLLPRAVLIPNPQGPHRPTEVVTIQREVSHRLMDPPILTEPIRPSRLPCVLTAVRRVLSLHERGVDRPAAHRRLEPLAHGLLAPNNDPPMARHHPVPLPLLM